MNFSKTIFLINDQARAVMCKYEGDECPKAKLVMFKTLDATVKVDDFLVVPTDLDTRHKMTVVKVAEVDVDPDYDEPTIIKWAICKIDKSTFERLCAEEGRAIKVVQSADANAKRDELRKTLLKNSMEGLKALPISTIEAAAVPADDKSADLPAAG